MRHSHRCGRESKVTYGDENDTYISISEIFIDLYNMFSNLSNTTQISILLLDGFIGTNYKPEILQIVRVLTVFFLISHIFFYFFFCYCNANDTNVLKCFLLFHAVYVKNCMMLILNRI